MSEPNPSARVGSTVAQKYRLLGVLGSGGMGAVYEARHLFTGRRVALKLMHPEVHASAGAVTRFLREAQAATSVGHPGIVEVLDAGLDTEQTVYLALEYLEGRSFAHAIESRSVTWQECISVTIDVLDALTAAHARGIIHRDIKPDNVFLVDKPEGGFRVKVLDFGIAKQIDPTGTDLGLTRTGVVLGTPYFMSPEQARGGDIDARSDLWSVGAMLFLAISGRQPFNADNYNVLIAAILTQTPPTLDTVCKTSPKGLSAIVARALERDVTLRWQSAGEMAAALRSMDSFDSNSLSMQSGGGAVIAGESAALLETVAASSVAPSGETLTPLERSRASASISRADRSASTPWVRSVVLGVIAVALIAVGVASLLARWSGPTTPPQLTNAAGSMVPAPPTNPATPSVAPLNQPPITAVAVNTPDAGQAADRPTPRAPSTIARSAHATERPHMEPAPQVEAAAPIAAPPVVAPPPTPVAPTHETPVAPVAPPIAHDQPAAVTSPPPQPGLYAPARDFR